MELLYKFGLDPFFIQQLDDFETQLPRTARVIEDRKGLYRAVGPAGEVLAEPSGKMYDQDLFPPVVGDWVLLRIPPEGRAVIDAVLRRQSALSRTRVDSNRRGDSGRNQVLAANVDTAFIVCALSGDLNQRSIERYLALVRGGGVRPVVLLTKADLRPDDVETAASLVREIAPEVEAIPVSAVTGEGLDLVEEQLAPGRTAVLLGPSGVGKSTLINRLLGRAEQETGTVRDKDQKGRHTTTGRRLFELPSGGLVIDTPGLRALALAGEAGLDSTFPDIDRLAKGCRFRDCGHDGEPGCAVEEAVRSGELAPGRLENFHKMRREAEAIERARDKRSAKKEGRRMAQMIAEVKRSPKSRFRNEG